MPKTKKKLICDICGCGEQEKILYRNIDGDDTELCKNCYHDKVVSCENCGKFFIDNINSYQVAGVNTTNLCNTCIDNYVQCCDCGNYLKMDDAIHYLSYYGTGYLCNYCCEQAYFVCEGCGGVCHTDRYNRGGLCDCCASDGDPPITKPHHYPMFQTDKDVRNGEKLYFGVELEVGFYENPLYSELCSGNPKWLFSTEDGSVDADYNIEWLISPMTWDYINEHKEDIKGFLRKTREYGGVESTNAGMHIHLPKDAFSGYQHEYKFFKMIHNNDNYWFEKSGRDDYSEINEWAEFMPLRSRYEEDEIRERLLSIHKHTAVNAYHESTFETRFFASTLNIDTYISNIELLYKLFCLHLLCN